ncbi:MAG: hypothetical protein ABRQ37_15885, partial [Candidatus Eremiobacterota bacterium]
MIFKNLKKISLIICLLLLFCNISYGQEQPGKRAEAEFHVQAGIKLQEQGKFADAEGEYKKSIEIDPSYVEGHVYLANIHFLISQQEIVSAVDILEHVLTIDPNNALA